MILGAWAALAAASSSLVGQARTGEARGALVLTGGDFGAGVVERFVQLAGGPDVSVVYIPSASSGIRLSSGFTWIPPELPDATDDTPQFEDALAAFFGVRNVTVLHSRERRVWDSDPFAAAIRRADAVWISSGNAGRLASFMLDTRSHRALEDLLAAGKPLGGNSAGAIIAGTFIVRGRPDKPVLMARDNTSGLGLVPGVAINPHLTEARREDELVQVIDAHPELLGIGLDEKAAIVVTRGGFEVIGQGRVAIYDDQRHERGWYYYLCPGALFDLRTRTASSPQATCDAATAAPR
jgi:cyanophycinase